jgi:hypothetical protein
MIASLIALLVGRGIASWAARLIVYGVLSAVLIGGTATAWHVYVAKPYYVKGVADGKAAQAKTDKPVIDKLTAQVAAAQKRATDLALLYSITLPRIDESAQAQKRLDDETIGALNVKIAQLSHIRNIPFSAGAMRVWNDVAAPSGQRASDGAATEKLAARTEGVPAAAKSVTFSEFDIVQHDADAHAAYVDAIGMFHECRDLYNGARAAQLKVQAE